MDCLLFRPSSHLISFIAAVGPPLVSTICFLLDHLPWSIVVPTPEARGAFDLSWYVIVAHPPLNLLLAWVATCLDAWDKVVLRHHTI